MATDGMWSEAKWLPELIFVVSFVEISLAGGCLSPREGIFVVNFVAPSIKLTTRRRFALRRQAKFTI